MTAKERAGSPVSGNTGALVTLLTVVGCVVLGWSMGSEDPVSTATGTSVVALAICWSFYRVEAFTGGP